MKTMSIIIITLMLAAAGYIIWANTYMNKMQADCNTYYQEQIEQIRRECTACKQPFWQNPDLTFPINNTNATGAYNGQ